jgi:hypothetical protein
MLFEVSGMPRESDYCGCFLRLAAVSSFILLGGAIAGAWDALAQNSSHDDQSYYKNAHPYLEEPLEKLVQQIPELKTLQPAADQQPLAMILEKTGERVRDFFRDIVDLTADEEIRQEKLSSNGTIKASRQNHYSYLILTHREELFPRLEEYRTNVKGIRAEQVGADKGFPVDIGFALECRHFLPGRRSDSTFVYLGDEMIGPRNTYVVAFAQRPGQATAGTWSEGNWSVAILVQGIAWIDKESFQIIRLRTDLLAPRRDVGLEQVTTELTLGEVQLPDLATPLWMPSEVMVRTEVRGKIYQNEHQYTNYKRFGVSIKIGP